MTNAVEYISQHEVSSNSKDSKTKKKTLYILTAVKLVIMNIRYFNYEIKKSVFKYYLRCNKNH